MTDAAKIRILFAVIAALLLIIGGMAYKFLVVGSTQQADDGRVIIKLAPAERALVLREMREFVSGLQAITDALSREDMKTVARVGRTLGSARAHDVPAVLMGKLPLEFKTLARGVHGEFDTIAMDAEAIGMPKHTLAQLASALQKCAACHASFQFQDSPVR